MGIVNFQQFLNVGLLFGKGKVENAEVVFFRLWSANEYQSVDHLAALHHSSFLGPPKSRIDDCCSVSSCSCAKYEISDGGGSSFFEDQEGRRDEDAEEGGIGPECNGVSEFAASA